MPFGCTRRNSAQAGRIRPDSPAGLKGRRVRSCLRRASAAASCLLLRTALHLAVPATVLLSGCASIPERELENAFYYQRVKHAGHTSAQPIASEFQDLADRAWDIRAAGATTQYVSILEIGDDALLARIHLIRSARRTIDLQTFIWKDDPTSRFVFDELVKAAERGVQVRVLIDALNMPGTPELLARMARAHRNLEICLYKPLKDHAELGRVGFWESLLFKTKHMNRRMHNKLLLIDGRIGITGGRNYEGKYYDRDVHFLFRDRDVLVAGPAAMDMQDSFELFWQDKNAVFVTQLKDVQQVLEGRNDDRAPFFEPADYPLFEQIDQQADDWSISVLRDALRIYEADRVQFIFDTPRKFRGRRERMDFDDWFLAVISASETRLVYQTPYLIYSSDARKLFKQLRKEHPAYRIVASSNSLAAADHLHVYALSFKHRKELYKKTGIDIYEAKPYPADQAAYVHDLDALVQRAITEAGLNPETVGDLHRAGPRLCIHAKSFVVDRSVVLIGSHNFDPRSARLNTECGLFIEDEEVAAVLEDRILNACEPRNAWTVSRSPVTPGISHFSGLIGTVSTALPVFDVWPYRYTTNYELKEGSEPLLPRAPNFQAHYTDVGYFPEVPQSSKVIQTRLMKAFFGWARPLM